MHRRSRRMAQTAILSPSCSPSRRASAGRRGERRTGGTGRRTRSRGGDRAIVRSAQVRRRYAPYIYELQSHVAITIRARSQESKAHDPSVHVERPRLRAARRPVVWRTRRQRGTARSGSRGRRSPLVWLRAGVRRSLRARRGGASGTVLHRSISSKAMGSVLTPLDSLLNEPLTENSRVATRKIVGSRSYGPRPRL